MQHSELIHRFVQDLQTEGCIVQVGTLHKVHGNLERGNLEKHLQRLEGKDGYFLGGVRADAEGRAKDADVLRKNYFFIDYDIRNYWKKEHGEEISDSDIKDRGSEIMHAFSTHPVLANWRYGIFTGNGIHIYYFGNTVTVTSPQQWKSGVEQILEIAKKVVGYPPDEGCVNVGRLARLPGTKNCKGDRKIQTEIFEYHEHGILDLSLIEKSVEASQSSVVHTSTSTAGDRIPQGKRNSTLTSYAGTLRRRNLDEKTIFESLCVINENKCDPPLDQGEVARIAKSVANYRNTDNQHAPERHLVVVKASSVEPKEVRWIWHGRIAKGKIALLVGHPGQGKSFASCAIAAAITKGQELPGHVGEIISGDILMFAIEDGIADTIRPRLDIVGADVSRIDIVTGVSEQGKEKYPSLETDLGLLEEYLKKENYKAIVLDPVNAYLGGKIDSYKDTEIRSILSPLAALAEKYDVAVLCIMHLNKAQGTNVLMRILGSIGYVGVARTVLFVGEHPTNYQERIIDCVKSNVGKIPPPIAFEIDDKRFSWIGETDARANDALNEGGQSESTSAVSEAEHFLLEELSDGPRKQQDILGAAKDANISQRTLQRAKSKLGVESVFIRDQEQRYWAWKIPNSPKNAKAEQLALLDGNSNPQSPSV